MTGRIVIAGDGPGHLRRGLGNMRPGGSMAAGIAVGIGASGSRVREAVMEVEIVGFESARRRT